MPLLFLFSWFTGNSVFLDERFQPYEDQWTLLASIRKVTRAHAESIAREQTMSADADTALAKLEAERETLEQEAFAGAWAKGQAMTLDEAVEYALRENGDGFDLKT